MKYVSIGFADYYILLYLHLFILYTASQVFIGVWVVNSMCNSTRSEVYRPVKFTNMYLCLFSHTDEFKLAIPSNEIESIGYSVTVPCHLSPPLSAVGMETRWFKGTDCVCLYKNRQVTEGQGFEDRVNLFREELERGDVSLQLRNCTESDSGCYLCQVTAVSRTEEITVAVQCKYSSTSLHVILTLSLVVNSNLEN